MKNEIKNLTKEAIKELIRIKYSYDELFCIQILKRLDDYYYNDGNSIIPDDEYDNYKVLIKCKFPRNKYFKEVGSRIKKDKVKLPFVLGSLKKFTEDDIYNWLKKYDENTEMIVMEKMDGVSIYCEFESGKMIKAYTRGNGEVGQNITHKFKGYQAGEFTGKLRGEIITTGSTYKDLGYKSRRHCASAIIADEYSTNDHHLSVYFYEIISDKFISVINQLQFLKNYGFNVPDYYRVSSKSNFSVEFFNDFIKNKKLINNYDIDGLVIAVSDEFRENVKYPKHKISYKLNDKKGKRTKLIKIIPQTTRTGNVVPVGKIEPVEIDGVTIENVTLYNYDYVVEKHLHDNCSVNVIRSNDVIPKVINVESDDMVKLNLPATCPECNTSLTKKSVHLYCPNQECSAKTFGTLSNFIKILELEQVSTKTLLKLNVSSIKNFVNLKIEDIENKEGFGRRSAEIIVSEIHNKILSEVKPEKLLASFGIEKLSVENAKRIIDSVDNFENVFELNFSDYNNIDGFGEILSDIFSYHIPKFKDVYEYLKSKGLKIKDRELISDSFFSGKIFTLTGKCDTMGRKELEKIINDNGGSVKGISKNTNYLITDDLESSSGKMTKAKKLKIDIMSYSELIEKM